MSLEINTYLTYSFGYNFHLVSYCIIVVYIFLFVSFRYLVFHL